MYKILEEGRGCLLAQAQAGLKARMHCLALSSINKPSATDPTIRDKGEVKDVLGFEKIKVPKITTVDPYAIRVEFRLKNGVNFYEVHEVIE